MCKLVCPISLFSMQQTIFLIDEENNKTTTAAVASLEDLSETLADISDIVKVNNIQLHGASQYADEIASEVLTYARTKYNNHDLIVEVVK